MTRDETLKIMAVLKATYPNFYKDMTRRACRPRRTARASSWRWTRMTAICHSKGVT